VTASTPRLVVEQLSRRFGGQLVVSDVALSIEAGKVMCLLGPSGCGKSTTLRMIAGVERPDTGRIWIDGAEVFGPTVNLPPEARGVGLMFQDFALFPHLTVAGNIAFGLKGDTAQKARRVAELLDKVNLPGFAEKHPHELSGGEQQRVALARALAPRPRVMLMDEPFSALDALTRGALQDEVARLVSETEQTGFMITHDVDEAILLADRILLMSNGPEARMAEVVVNTLPKPRTRANLHHMPGYHALRDHILDFLIARSRAFKADAPPVGWSARAVPEVSPALSPPPLAAE
jgi:ABC-type Fe3+/spermidine/putrescine transport system ATPase subunit